MKGNYKKCIKINLGNMKKNKKKMHRRYLLFQLEKTSHSS